MAKGLVVPPLSYWRNVCDGEGEAMMARARFNGSLEARRGGQQ
jgi:hypothetical protein